jgi:tetratricopeptide (TPR) repeat protein
MLAHHYERGEVWGKALEYLVKAGQKAQQAYANQEALVHYDRALEVCKRLGAAVAPSTLIALYAGKGAVHFVLSEFHSVVEAYQGMMEVARQIGDQAKEADAFYQIGFGFFWAHEFEKALEFSHRAKALALEIGNHHILAASLDVTGLIHGVTGNLGEAAGCWEEALRISREAGDKGLEGLNLNHLGELHNWKGEYEQALQLQEQAFTIGRVHNLQPLLLSIFWHRGLSSCGKGEYKAALGLLKDGLELSKQLGDKHWRCRILNTVGWVYKELYNLEQSFRYNQEGAEASYELGDPEIIRNAEINLGDCYMLLRDFEQAQRYLEKVYRDSQQRGKWGEGWAKWRYSQHLYHSLGELSLIKGDTEQALAFAEECLKLAEPTVSRKNLVKGWRLKGQAFCAQGRLPEAEEPLRKALTIAKEIGNPPQLWKTYQALGELYERKGDTDQARSAYVSAMQVIEAVAGRLQDQELKQTFQSARPVQEIRMSLERFKGSRGAGSHERR